MIGRDGSREDVAPSRSREGVDGRREVARRNYDAVDPAAQGLERAYDAQRRRVTERQVDHAVLGVIQRVAAVGAAENHLLRGVERARVWGIRYELDGAALRSRAVQCSLRTAQHLDAIQVVKIRIDDDLAVLGSRGGGERCVVEVEADRG